MAEPGFDIFISADIESDGSIPGEFSMLSFGLCVAGAFDGERYYRAAPDDTDRAFYVELKPISERFESEALAVNGLDREALAQHGAEPVDAMSKAAEWVRAVANNARPVLVAYPVAFDWSFLYWYFMRFNEESPFGFSSCLDIRSIYQARTLAMFDDSSQKAMPSWLLPSNEHTHNARDDALEQAELFSNIFEWALDGGGCERFLNPVSTTPNWMRSMAFADLPSGTAVRQWKRRRRPPLAAS